MNQLERAWDAIVNFFWAPTDARPYAATRMAFAFAALFNWCEMFVRRESLFGPHGMIDGDIVRRAVAGQPYFSVFYYARSDAAVTAVFLLALAGIVALGAGFFTRVAALVVYVFHVSYSHFDFAVLHSWDALLRIYSFLILISPTEAVWSWDQRRAARKGKPFEPPAIYGLRLMQWQLAVVYVSTVWLKVPDVNWRNGRLLSFFQMSMYSRFPDSTLLVKYEVLSDLLTFGSLAVELSVVFLLWSRRWRWVGASLGVSLHVGIALTSRLTVFSLCIVAPYFAFFEAADFDRATAWLQAQAQRRGLMRGASR